MTAMIGEISLQQQVITLMEMPTVSERKSDILTSGNFAEPAVQD